MIEKIDISDFEDEVYNLNDEIEFVFQEDGVFIFTPTAWFEVNDMNDIKFIEKKNSFVIINKQEGDYLELSKEQYEIFKNLYEKKNG